MQALASGGGGGPDRRGVVANRWSSDVKVRGLSSPVRGDRRVATGGAARRPGRPTRNPWSDRTRGACPGRGNGSLGQLFSFRRPFGTGLIPTPSHGLRFARSGLRSTRGYSPWPLPGPRRHTLDKRLPPMSEPYQTATDSTTATRTPSASDAASVLRRGRAASSGAAARRCRGRAFSWRP